MRKPAIRRGPAKASETSLHMTVAGFLRRAWPAHLPWWHTPNGENRDARTGGKLKAMGALAGVPDLIFLLPDKQIAFIELKQGSGDLSEVQIKFRDRVQALGCAYAVCRSPEDVETTITRWLKVYGLVPTACLIRRAA